MPVHDCNSFNDRTRFPDGQIFHAVNWKTLTDDCVRIEALPFGNGKDGSGLTLNGSRDFDPVPVAGGCTIRITRFAIGDRLH